MLTINKYFQTFHDNFYIDALGNVRRTKDGYQGRFKKDDLAVFHLGTDGYLHIQIPQVRATVKKSHLVLLLSGTNIPDDKEVDHLDGDRNNDHPTNLRVVNRRVNSCNRKCRADNSSGVTGIRWSDYHQHFVIRRTVNGVRYSRSRDTMEAALLVLAELTALDSNYTMRHGI